jgi:hypothetical protein
LLHVLFNHLNIEGSKCCLDGKIQKDKKNHVARGLPTYTNACFIMCCLLSQPGRM